MSKVILYIAQTLDGFISDENGGVTWLDPFSDQGSDYGYTEFYESVDTLIMGSNTYKQILDFGEWPYPDTQTFVCSQQNLESENESIKITNKPLTDLISEMKTRAQKDIWLVGGAALIKSAIDSGVLDEMILFTMPCYLSKGIPLFNNLDQQPQVELINSRTHKSVIETHYRFIKNIEKASIDN